jgi:hypothetical protein
MNVQRIRDRLKPPFKPFSVVVSSGHQYPVPHPEFIFLTERTVIVADKNGYVVNLDPLHVVGLQDIPRANGKHRRRRSRH